MPEGDTLYRLAARLAPVLEGREILSLTARRLTNDTARSLVGRKISSVAATGKNLLVHFDDGRAIHIHLMMEGRVSVERPRSTFWRPERVEPDLRLVVRGASVVGRRLAVLRLLSAAQLERAARGGTARPAHAPDLGQLGPDLVRPDWDEPEAVRRLRSLPPRTEIAHALLVQRAVAGIGNVYKSEVLFLEKVHPRTLIASLSDDELLRLLRRASDLLRKNLGDGPRTTRPTLGGPRLWVYGRGARACLRCKTPIERSMQGATGSQRSTYHCPRCQPPFGDHEARPARATG